MSTRWNTEAGEDTESDRKRSGILLEEVRSGSSIGEKKMLRVKGNQTDLEYRNEEDILNDVSMLMHHLKGTFKEFGWNKEDILKRVEEVLLHE